MIITTLLPHSVLAIKINEDQISHMAKIIYKDCQNQIITNECPATHVFKNCTPNQMVATSKEIVEKQIARLDNIYGFGTMTGGVMLCKENDQILHRLVSTSNCYLWDGKCISTLPSITIVIFSIGGISLVGITILGFKVVKILKNKKRHKK